jgi:5-methylcytosine-specific restriction enzyme A
MKLQRLKPTLQVAHYGPEVRTLPVSTGDPDSWRYGRTAAQRGYDAKWRKARLTYLSRPDNVCCRACKALGIYTEATVVDHVIPHRGNTQLFWDTSNWQPLCAPCHDEKTKQGE